MKPSYIFYMVSSVGAQHEPNRALWLATRAGKMAPSSSFGTTRSIPQEKGFVRLVNLWPACEVKMAGYWPCCCCCCCFSSLWTSTPSRSINTQKKELSQYPTTLTSHLVNNVHVIELAWSLALGPSTCKKIFASSLQSWRNMVVQ